MKVGGLAWLSFEHLSLVPGLSRKLADKFVGPFEVLEKVGVVSYGLKLPIYWRVHDVFHVLQLKAAVGLTAVGEPGDGFRPRS